MLLIQGDGINIDSVEPILDRLMGYGWSADNVSFGSGGGLLQQMNRDTQRFAFKASSGVVDGVFRKVSKRPVTDLSKQSKQGRLKLVDDNGVLRTVGAGDARTGLLQTVFEDGVCRSSWSFNDIRNLAGKGLRWKKNISTSTTAPFSPNPI